MPLERQSGQTGRFFLRNDFAFQDETDTRLDQVPTNPPIASAAASFPTLSASPSVGDPAIHSPTARGGIRYYRKNTGTHQSTETERSSSDKWVFHVPRVLVADDNLLVRTSLLHLLEKWKFNHHLASCGLTAWEALQAIPFDLVLIDLQMPGMDGHELVRKLRETAGNINQDVPVVAMAGSTDSWAREQMLEAGACAYLEKPLQPKQLFETVTNNMQLPAYKQVQLFTDVLDQKILGDLYQGDLEHMSLMFDLFLRKTPEVLQLMQEAVRQHDYQLLLKEIHSVKPTFAMVGVPQLTDMAAELESYIEHNQGIMDGKFQAGFLQFTKAVQQTLSIIYKEQEAIRESLK